MQATDEVSGKVLAKSVLSFQLLFKETPHYFLNLRNVREREKKHLSNKRMNAL
jgi:hypothetical protein